MPRSRLLVLFSVAIVAAIALLLQPSQGVDATFFRPGVLYRTCTDGTGNSVPTFACTLNNNDSTTLDTVTGFDIAPPDSNFSAVAAFTDSTYYTWANDAAITNGAVVGELHSLATLGLVNGGCFTQLLVDFTFVDSTTDFITAGAVDPAKVIAPAGPADNRLLNLAQDDGDYNNDGDFTDPGEPGVLTANGLPDGADKYPLYVATALDPDGAGPALPLVPRQRFLGVAVVANVVVILQFTVMEPGALRARVADGMAAASFGYGSLTFLQDPTEAPTNGAITDFCTPLSTTTHLDGTTRDNECTPAPGPAQCSATVPGGGGSFTVRIPTENGTRAGDVTPCDTVPNECGTARFSSLAVPAGGATSLYAVQSMSLRGTNDGDAHENNLDPCFAHNDSTWDPRAALPGGGPGDADGDGLPDSCDPNDTPGPGFNDDQDDDGWQNRNDNCPLVKNGDTTSTMFEAVGDTALNVASTVGFPSSPGFHVDVDSAASRERVEVVAITPGTPGVFTIDKNLTPGNQGVGFSSTHLAGVAVVQIFRSNINSGQGDFDVPFPATTLEGSRSEFIGPECDTGTVGGEVLSPTVPNGHYHRTASIARNCIRSAPAAPEDADNDGVCDADDPNDASGDSDGDSSAVGEPERIYNSADNVVSTGDIRLTATSTGLAVGLAAGTVVSCPVDFDCGNALAGFLATERHTDDEGGAGAYNVNECGYSSADAVVSNGDRRLRNDTSDVPTIPGPPDASPNCNFPGGSTVVCPGNSDCGAALVGFVAAEKHIDSRLVSIGLTATDYRNAFQTCTNRFSDDSDTEIDFADSDCLGAHFDTFDDCISLANTAPVGFSQTDEDADGVGDACDSLVDSDVDGTSDFDEEHIATGLDTVCARTSAENDELIDAQPEDINDSRTITGADLSAIAAFIGQAVPPAPVRLDIAPPPHGAITGADLSKVSAIIGSACSP